MFRLNITKALCRAGQGWSQLATLVLVNHLRAAARRCGRLQAAGGNGARGVPGPESAPKALPQLVQTSEIKREYQCMLCYYIVQGGAWKVPTWWLNFSLCSTSRSMTHPLTICLLIQQRLIKNWFCKKKLFIAYKQIFTCVLKVVLLNCKSLQFYLFLATWKRVFHCPTLFIHA